MSDFLANMIPEAVLSGFLVVFLLAIIFKAVRSRKPDPEMTLLLKFIAGHVGSAENGPENKSCSADSQPEEEIGPYGPGSFTHPH